MLDIFIVVKPNIPVVSISIEDARIILANFTYAGNVSAGSNKNYWFGLPLNSNPNSITLNYKGIVTVNHDVDKNVTLNNVIATIPGKHIFFLLSVDKFCGIN